MSRGPGKVCRLFLSVERPRKVVVVIRPPGGGDNDTDYDNEGERSHTS